MARFNLEDTQGRCYVLNRVISSIRDACDTLLRNVVTTKIGQKEDGTPLTKMDKPVEEFLKARFRKELGITGWVGEETEEIKERYCWMVDPIDGTTNFGLGGEYWTISVALADIEKKEVLLGAVYRPKGNKLYLFRKEDDCDHSWFERETLASGRFETVMLSLSPSTSKAFPEYIITAYGPSRHMNDRPEDWIAITKVFTEMEVPETNRKYKMIQGRRGAGCASLTLCRIAEGEEHGAILLCQAPWDIAAGAMIAKSAGCRMRVHPNDVYSSALLNLEEAIATAKKDTLIDIYCFANEDVEKTVMKQFAV